jgi:hypothetical protein
MSKHSFVNLPRQSASTSGPKRVLTIMAVLGAVVLLLELGVPAQSSPPYPNAVTDRWIHPKTPMSPPPVNSPFIDPDFGSKMVRVTDQNSDFLHPGGYLRTEGGGTANMWSADSSKFYVLGQGGSVLAYSFNPSTMNIGSLPTATAGQGLHVPLRGGGSFSFTDSDLMYGTTDARPLAISSYRFSTGVTSVFLLASLPLFWTRPLVECNHRWFLVQRHEVMTMSLLHLTIIVCQSPKEAPHSVLTCSSLCTTRNRDVVGITPGLGKLAGNGVLLEMQRSQEVTLLRTPIYPAAAITFGLQ